MLVNFAVTYDSAAFSWPATTGLRELEGHRLVRRAAALFDATPRAVIGASRIKPLVRCRWGIILTLSRRGWSTPRIGHLLGNRDHTTIMYGLRKAANLYCDSPAFRAYCDELGKVA